MKTRPTTFLSHSKADREIIKSIADDLRACRIDAWYDEWEIPPGVSFQRKIFNDGIPNCDSFFIYLTYNSANSYWVQKELDAFFIEQNRNRGVAIIAFVDSDETRSILPADIASLNSPLLNRDNYCEALPKLIARIFEAKLERVLAERSLEEENARLRLEKEVESLQKQIITIQSMGTQSLEEIFEKLNNKILNVAGNSVTEIELFKSLIPLLSTGSPERFLERRLKHVYLGESSWEVRFIDETGIAVDDILAPLIVNFLVEIQKGTDQIDQLFFLSDLGKRFTSFLEGKP